MKSLIVIKMPTSPSIDAVVRDYKKNIDLETFEVLFICSEEYVTLSIEVIWCPQHIVPTTVTVEDIRGGLNKLTADRNDVRARKEQGKLTGADLLSFGSYCLRNKVSGSMAIEGWVFEQLTKF